MKQRFRRSRTWRTRMLRRCSSIVRGHSSPEDVLVFSKPRSLALFTGRRVAALSPDQNQTQQLAFLNSIHATILVDAAWSEIKAGDVLAANER